LKKFSSKRKIIFEDFIYFFSDLFVALTIFNSTAKQIILFVGADHIKTIHMFLKCLTKEIKIDYDDDNNSRDTNSRCLRDLEELKIQ
jgi:membrane-anchored protein YejM (alkaline phosphatase superfamily)